MSDSEDSTVTYTEVSSLFEDLSDIGSPGVDGLPMMLEDPYAYVEASLQAPPSPDYVPGPEEPKQACPPPEVVLEPIYLEFMPPEDDVLIAEEQPLPFAISPTADPPGYIPESDPEKDPEEDDEDLEEDPADYPTNREDKEEESSRDDGDDDEEDEEEEHPALANSIPPPPVHHTTARKSIPVQAPVPFLSKAETPLSVTPPSETPLLLPIPLPTSSPPLLLPSTNCRADAPEVTLPLERGYALLSVLDLKLGRVHLLPLLDPLEALEQIMVLLALWMPRLDNEAILSCKAWVQPMDASDTTRVKVMSLRTTVLAQQIETVGLQTADRRIADSRPHTTDTTSRREDTNQSSLPPIAPPEALQMVSSVKLPILKKVILNGNGEVQMTKDKAGNEVEVPPITTHQILARTRERKAKSTMLMAIPDEHLARFHAIKDAKTLWAAIKTRFGVVHRWIMRTYSKLIKIIWKRWTLNGRGHFARDCRTARNLGNRGRDAGNEGYKGRDNGNSPAKEEDEKALVVQDGLGTYDWSYQLEEEATDFALIAFTSNPSSSNSEGVFVWAAEAGSHIRGVCFQFIADRECLFGLPRRAANVEGVLFGCQGRQPRRGCLVGAAEAGSQHTGCLVGAAEAGSQHTGRLVGAAETTAT
nr:xylulose kinase-1 [Tanacetum cinerariifolium]